MANIETPADSGELLRYAIKKGVDANNKQVFTEVFADPVEILEPSDAESLPLDYFWEQYQAERAALPDLTHNIHQIWQSEDMVFASYSGEATFEGELVLGEGMVVEPTGETLDVSGLMQARVVNGEITGWNGYWNKLEAYQQAGIIPSFDELTD